MAVASQEADIVASYAEPGEEVRAALAGYTNAGLRRRVIGVTDRRLVVVRSGYWSLSDKGLLWAEDLEQVALHDSYSVWTTGLTNTGNAYLGIRRSDGRVMKLNPRNSFIGQTRSAEDNIKLLYKLIPGRY
jgi:hypothetical protein